MARTATAEAHPPLTLSAFGKARSTVQGTPLSADELRKTDAFWRACNYLILGMLYLQENPLLRDPLKPEHIKDRLLGHWGSSPGLAFSYIHQRHRHMGEGLQRPGERARSGHGFRRRHSHARGAGGDCAPP
jgi:hypothetical protein